MIGDLEHGAASVARHLGLAAGWSWESQLLSATPGLRTVACYRFRRSSGRRRPLQVVGKFYANPAEGAHCFGAMTTLHGQLAGLNEPILAVPEPLYYDPQRCFLAQRWVQQRPYPELLDGRSFHNALRWAGRALAQLHRLPIDPAPVKTTGNHLIELMSPTPTDLADGLPELAPRIHAIASALGQIEHTTVAPIHRDFHLRQLFYGARRVWLIDWDQYAFGDPALDVGNFLVYLETHLNDRIEPAQQAFLEGYGVRAGDPLWARLPGFRALTYLRLACKAYRLQKPDWPERLARMLDRAEAAQEGTG
jgi:hypothetical protein